ncbi:MAG: tRNA adenosine(34) deaminase TadA [Gammaproteobacteria bacterium]|nr:tRNA adenosine(34) deaminase TadA [Gammaproteobacteria bacterium]
MPRELESPDIHWMRHALELATLAAREGEVPVGAVLVRDGGLIAEGRNSPIAGHDPTAHAEIQVLRAAGKALNNYRLGGTTLYVTLEPCPMCAGAIIHARVQRVVFAAPDPRTGAAGSIYNILQSNELNHRCEVDGGVLARESGALLRDFFRSRR